MVRRHRRAHSALDAERELQQAYETRVELLGSDHPDVAEILYELAEVQVLRAGFDSAAVLPERFIRDALEVRERFYPPEHTKIAVMGVDNLSAAIQRNNLARHLCTFGKAAEGVRHSEAAVRISDDVFDEGFYVTGVFRSTQASCLGGVGGFSRAEEVFLNALNILDTALGPDSSHSVTLRGRLAKMYDDWGKPDLAAAIRSR